MLHRYPRPPSPTRPGRLSILRTPSLLALLLLLVPLAACTMNPSEDSTATATTSGAASTSTAIATPTPTATPTTSASATATSPVATPAESPTATPSVNSMTVSVYFLRDEKIGTAHRSVAETQQVGTVAMQELLKGPTAQETAAGLTTSVPAGVTLQGLTIANKVATVNLSKEFESGGGSLSMATRLAQVVYTLTQFPTVEAVNFQLDGTPVSTFGGEGLVLDHPVGRADFEDLTPIIFVESPVPNDTVTTPLHMTGTANTFEAVFTVEVLDENGKVLVEQHPMATSGSGTRGTFDVTVPFKIDQRQQGTIVVFAPSMKDGSRTNEVKIPVTLEPE